MKETDLYQKLKAFWLQHFPGCQIYGDVKTSNNIYDRSSIDAVILTDELTLNQEQLIASKKRLKFHFQKGEVIGVEIKTEWNYDVYDQARRSLDFCNRVFVLVSSLPSWNKHNYNYYRIRSLIDDAMEHSGIGLILCQEYDGIRIIRGAQKLHSDPKTEFIRNQIKYLQYNDNGGSPCPTTKGSRGEAVRIAFSELEPKTYTVTELFNFLQQKGIRMSRNTLTKFYLSKYESRQEYRWDGRGNRRVMVYEVGK